MSAAPETASPPLARRIACPRCAAPMRELALSSHKGEPVAVEHCRDCRLVWFDEFESVQLDGFGWVRLLREMEAGAGRPLPEPQVAHPACPACAATLKRVQNRSRFGLFAALECPRRHGHLHSHSGLLAERGLVRPLGVAERRALAEEKHALHCLNCGAAASARDDHCSYCGTALAVIDMPRLAHSLRLQLDGAGPSPQAIGRATVWPCRACGAALDPARDIHCPHCGHMVIAQALPDIDPLLAVAEADLAHAAEAEAKRLSRYASARRPRRPAARDDAPSTAGGTRRPAMMSGWAPLLLALAAALAIAIVVIGELHWPGPPSLESLRDQRLGARPGSAWALLPEWRDLQPGDRNGLQALRRALLAVHARQLAGEHLPATATFGQVIDGTLPRAGFQRDPIELWNAAVSRSLHPEPAAAEPPLGDEAAEIGGRLTPSAPNVWVQAESRTDGLWALTVQNAGSFTILAHKLAVAVPLAGHAEVGWRCRPARGANPVVAPGAQVLLFCRTKVSPRWQEEYWRAAMYKLRSGETADLRWTDEAITTPAGLEAATDRLVADAVKGPAATPPKRSLRERWSTLPGPRRHALLLAGLLAAFSVFCMLVRALGERRTAIAAMGVGAVASYLAGRGEGAASVLLVGMYLALCVLLTFVFAFGARIYLQLFFARSPD